MTAGHAGIWVCLGACSAGWCIPEALRRARVSRARPRRTKASSMTGSSMKPTSRPAPGTSRLADPAVKEVAAPSPIKLFILGWPLQCGGQRCQALLSCSTLLETVSTSSSGPKEVIMTQHLTPCAKAGRSKKGNCPQGSPSSRKAKLCKTGAASVTSKAIYLQTRRHTIPDKRLCSIHKQLPSRSQQGDGPKGSTGCRIAEGLMHGVQDWQMCHRV